jgi:hypothetical protein
MWAVSKPMRLLLGTTVLGTIEDLVPDFPWWDGRFVPEPAFERIRPLFEGELRLLNEDRIEELEQEWGRIRAMDLRLDLGDGPALLFGDEFLLHIEGDRLRVRY